MVGWAAKRCGHGAEKAQFLQIELINEGINEANRIVVRDILIERRRKE